MSEETRPAGRQRKRLTTGHHTLDLWAAGSPIALAAFAFLTAWHFDTFSTIGILLRVVGFALALLGLVILGLRVHVPNHRDYYGGLALMGLALLAFWAGADLAAMRGFSFGAGTAPRLFASGLAIVAALITVSGLVTKGEPIGGYAVRGPLFVTLAILSFAFRRDPGTSAGVRPDHRKLRHLRDRRSRFQGNPLDRIAHHGGGSDRVLRDGFRLPAWLAIPALATVLTRKSQHV